MTRIASRIRFVAVLTLLAGVAFYAGVSSIRPAPVRPPIHPVTGRQIAGIATDTRWLDRTAREQEEAPEQALLLIGIQPGMSVADVGAGTGYMTTRLAPLVGPGGKVYATDLQIDMLRIIEAKAREQHLANVVVVQGAERTTGLPDGCCDVVLLVDVYHELWYPQDILESIHRALKADGRLILIEYRNEDPTIPIAPTHRMSVADARRELESSGFAFDRLLDGLPRQHLMVFTPAPATPAR
jgi:predicted methyltransferase